MSCIGMFLVLLAGALVTNTESGRGCGDDWPLCNGKFIPAFTLETAIEYSHRAVTGVVGIIVLATFVLTIRLFRRHGHREPLWYAGLTLAFTIIQALMGAAAVMWYQSPPVMALHFGISLLAVASTVLLVIWVRRHSKGYDAATAPGCRARSMRSCLRLAFIVMSSFISARSSAIPTPAAAASAGRSATDKSCLS